MDQVSSGSVNLRVSKELYTLFGTQERLNKFLWSSEASYSFTLEKSKDGDPEQDAEAGLGVPSRAWHKATSGRRHFEGTLGNLRGTLAENANQLYGMTLVQYYAAFERYLYRRSGAYRRRTEEHNLWSPLISGCAHLGVRSQYPLPIEHVLSADTSRFLRNLIAHGE